jgi:malate dehydrogenase
MVEAILKDQNRLLPCAVYADRDYGLKDVYIGLPTVLGRDGVKKIVDLKLTEAEKASLHQSAKSIKENIDLMNQLLVAV